MIQRSRRSLLTIEDIDKLIKQSVDTVKIDNDSLFQPFTC